VTGRGDGAPVRPSATIDAVDAGSELFGRIVSLHAADYDGRGGCVPVGKILSATIDAVDAAHRLYYASPGRLI